MSSVHLSVVAPAHNEEDNIDPLVEEIASALADASYSWEIVLVDDGSTDGTLERMLSAQSRHPEIRVIRMLRTPAGRGNGQSAAYHAAFRTARGGMIALLDADLQNDPADIPRLVVLLDQEDADLVQGDRSQNRRDTIVRRVSSFVGRAFRWMILGDTIRDTGCSLRVMRREVALRLPLEFRGMHRFIPVTARQLGYRVIEVPVHHRAGCRRGEVRSLESSDPRSGRLLRSPLDAPPAPASGVRRVPFCRGIRSLGVRVMLDSFLEWAHVDSAWELWLIVFGLGAQSLFFARWLVQWIAIERRGESHMPVAFWWVSLVGASLMLVYFLLRGEPVGAIGQCVGWAVYSRNLMLIRRKARHVGVTLPQEP